MDEKKCCNDECCERDEPLTQAEADGRNMATQYDHGDVPCDRPEQGFPIPNEGRVLIREEEPCAGTNNPQRMNDVVVKQMDYGYLVKVGCQTLCIEKPEHLTQLFAAYIKDPQKVMDLHYKKKLDDIYVDAAVEKMKNGSLTKDKHKVQFAVVGKTLKDVNDYLLMMLGGAFYKKDSVFIVETKEADLHYHAVTTVNHLVGREFNRVIETHAARENKDFGLIMKTYNETRR